MARAGPRGSLRSFPTGFGGGDELPEERVGPVGPRGRSASRPKCPTRLSAAARCTLGVYLLHPMLILIPQHLGIWEPAVLPLWLAVPLRALGVYAVTLAVSLLLSRVPAVGRLVA